MALPDAASNAAPMGLHLSIQLMQQQIHPPGKQQIIDGSQQCSKALINPCCSRSFSG